jgi:hypothetical protein
MIFPRSQNSPPSSYLGLARLPHARQAALANILPTHLTMKRDSDAKSQTSGIATMITSLLDLVNQGPAVVWDMSSLFKSWLANSRTSIIREAELLSQQLEFSPTVDCFPLLSLPQEIIESICLVLDLESLQSLRRASKQFGDCTNPLLFGTLRVGFRLQDLKCLDSIAANHHLSKYVHTLLYVGDQCRDYETFAQWKAASGVEDLSPPSAHFRTLPAEPPPWTLEHAQWRGYRQYQRLRNEQKVSNGIG